MKQDNKVTKQAHTKEAKRARLKPTRRASFMLPICIGLLFVTFVYAAIQFGSVSQAKSLVSDSLAVGTAPRGHQSSFSDTALKQTLTERPPGVSATPNVAGEGTRQLDAPSNGTSNQREARTETQALVSLLGYDPKADIIPAPSAPIAISTQTESSVLSYDGNNNLLSTVETLSDGSQKTELNQYDAWNRVTQTTDRNGRVQKYGYDNVGNQISYTDSDGIVTTREFDTKNRMVKVMHPTLGTVRLAYTAADELKIITHPNGTVTNRTYDLAGRLASITVNQGAVVVSQRIYTFDANGNRLTQVEKNGGAAETTSYEYDLDNRLVKVIGPDQTETYTIDPAGNRKTEVVKNLANEVLANKTYSYNSREQLLSVADGANATTYSYDGNGNQTSVKVGAAPATQYIWNARDQLASLSTGEAFEYDSAGHRTAKTGGGNRTLYVWSGDDLMAETNTIGNSFSQYTRAGSLLLGEVRNGVAQHFDQDAFNSIIVTTLADGTVPGRLSYRAYGQVRSATGLIESPFRFNGYVSDGGDQLSSPSRYYSLGTGRFTSMDPAAPTQMDPLSWNAYLGLSANPMFYIDPNGKASVSRNIESAAEGCGAITCGFYALGYGLYNVGTAGFGSVHDPILDSIDDGQTADSKYWSHAVAGGVAVAAVSLATARVGGGVYAASTSTVGRYGAATATGAAVGAVADSSTQGVHIAAGIQADYDLRRTAEVSAYGAAFGPAGEFVGRGIARSMATRAATRNAAVAQDAAFMAQIDADFARVTRIAEGIEPVVVVEQSSSVINSFDPSKPVIVGRFTSHSFEGRRVFTADPRPYSLGVPSSADPKFVHQNIRKRIDGGWTNTDLMNSGYSPIGNDGRPVNLHHVIGTEPGPMVELAGKTHSVNHKILHGLIEDGNSFRNIPGLESKYNSFRARYWKARGAKLSEKLNE